MMESQSIPLPLERTSGGVITVAYGLYNNSGDQRRTAMPRASAATLDHTKNTAFLWHREQFGYVSVLVECVSTLDLKSIRNP